MVECSHKICLPFFGPWDLSVIVRFTTTVMNSKSYMYVCVCAHVYIYVYIFFFSFAQFKQLTSLYDIWLYRYQHYGTSFALMLVEPHQRKVVLLYLSFAWQQNHLLQFLVLTYRTSLILGLVVGQK